MENRTAPSAPREGLGRLGVKFYRYKNLVLRKWWIMALTIAIGLAYQAYKVSQMPRLFESTSQLLIKDEYIAPTTSTIRVGSTQDFVGTNLAMLKSDDVLQRARQKVSIDHPSVNGEPPEISTAVIPRTQIFTITGRGLDPNYTQKFVNATVMGFMELRRENREKEFSTMGSAYGRRAQDKEAALVKAQAELDAYVKENNMAFWQEQAKSSSSFFSELKTNQAKLQTELQRYQMLTPDQLLVIPPTQPGSMATTGGNVQDNTGAGALSANLYNIYLQESQKLSVAQNRLEERSKVWKDKHPKLIALKDEVGTIQRALELVKQQNREATAQRVDAIKAELASLDQSIKTWEAKVAEASVKDGEYNALMAKVARLQKESTELRQEGEKTEGPATDAFQILQEANPPMEVNKNIKKHLMMGLIGGFMAGLAILILLDRADDRMTSSSEILDQFSEPIMGQIPNVEDSRDKVGLPLLQPDDERYSYAEAFRSLRSSLIFMPNQTELRTILVTSAIPNEGKSTITSNLAITMAAAGANVVVVDADLRRGDLAALFDMDGRTGLSNVLRGEVPWQSAVQETRYPNLTLLPRGPVTNQSSELLLLPTLQKLLDGLKDNYDLIIFNTAPILATDDTPSLSPSFDGTVMVMRAHFTSARLTQNALNALYQRQVNVLGLVLNCVDTEMPDYYYYRYPKYYAATS